MPEPRRTSTARATQRRNLPAPDRFDILLVAVLCIAYAVGFVVGASPREDLWIVIPCFLLTLAPLLWRTSAPVAVLVLVISMQAAAFAALGISLLWDAQLTVVPVLVALGAVAARRPLRVSLLGLPLAYAYLATLWLSAFPAYPAWTLFTLAVACTLAWGLGIYAHHNHRRIGALQAERRRATAAVELERSSIAAELNGIITLAVRQMMDDAATARATIQTDLERAAESLSSIESTGIEAMHELRRLLHVLHDSPGFALEQSLEPKGGARLRPFADRLLSITGWDVAITVGAILVTMFLAAQSMQGWTLVLACLYFGVTLSVLLWRHHFPLTVFLIVVAAYAGAVLLFYNGDFFWDSGAQAAPVLVALAAVAAGVRVWASIPVLIISWAYVSLASAAYVETFPQNLAVYAALCVTVWLAGALAGKRRRHIAELESVHTSATQAVEQERGRLAYELHDVIGHSLTVMILQAAGARRIIHMDSNRAAQALDAIDQAGIEATRELEQLVAVLQDDGTDSVDRLPEPLSGFTDLHELIERTRPTIQEVKMRVHGEPRRLEPSVDRAAYCVVREALTNVIKHAGPDARITIDATWADAVLEIDVASSMGKMRPAQAPDLSGGFGLVSLSERVRVAGGELHWSSDGTLFRLEARLPIVQYAPSN